MRIAMIGTGYVGLVTGACFSEFGIETWCVDKDPSKIEGLKRGELPIYEPGLDELVNSNYDSGQLQFTTEMSEAIPQADVVFIAVGTPETPEGDADMTYVYAAAEEIAQHLDGYTVVVTKSTVPVGTSRKVAEIIAKARLDADFDVASNPEFLREGSAVGDFMRPDRVVVGANSARALKTLRRLYRPLRLSGVAIEETTAETAELAKYAANSFLATKISFINEVADLCEKVDGDVLKVSRSMGLDERIGSKFLNAGPGYGGSCFPKDTKAFSRIGKKYGAPQRIVETVIRVNDERKAALVDRVETCCDGDLAGKRVVLLGLTFKPQTDDVRESPALDLIPALIERGAEVVGCDPMGIDQIKRDLGSLPVTYTEDTVEAAAGADCLVLLTDWQEFKQLDFGRLLDVVNEPVLLDLRNLYDPEEVAAHGFDYHNVGRRPAFGRELKAPRAAAAE